MLTLWCSVPCSLYNLILDRLLQVDKIGTKTSHPHHQVTVFLRVLLSIHQDFVIHYVELNVVNPKVDKAPEVGNKSFPVFPLQELRGKPLIEQVGLGVHMVYLGN